MYLLDSNMISAYLKNIVRVVDKFDEIWYKKEPMFIDGIIYYEIKGGLLHVNATAKLRQFYQLLQRITILWLNQDVADKASEIYSNLRRSGRTIPDTDVLIAATALAHNLILVTDDSHFQRVEDITVENWLRA
ncbi:type II toxin-antitoxin system VapC family toxin [Candidatus Poribacteria bacterium]|nr:type II toxin-antitoxin system VapC family toxin [Candidatus Poribacteria bacterium]